MISQTVYIINNTHGSGTFEKVG